MYIHFYRSIRLCPSVFFFFNDTATTEIYTLSLHDALPISRQTLCLCSPCLSQFNPWQLSRDRKSTRLNSSHEWISYAVFCLKKKNSGKCAVDLVRASHHNELEMLSHRPCRRLVLAQHVLRRALAETARMPDVFFLMIRRPRRSTLFPYTTLFRSRRRDRQSARLQRLGHRRRRLGDRPL